MRIPTPIPEVGPDREARRAINRVIEALKALQVRGSATVEIDQTAQGTFIRAKGTGGNSNPDNIAPRWG